MCLGKPHFCVHEDLERLFMAAWTQQKKNPNTDQLEDVKEAVHKAIANYRKKNTVPTHQVSNEL